MCEQQGDCIRKSSVSGEQKDYYLNWDGQVQQDLSANLFYSS